MGQYMRNTMDANQSAYSMAYTEMTNIYANCQTVNPMGAKMCASCKNYDAKNYWCNLLEQPAASATMSGFACYRYKHWELNIDESLEKCCCELSDLYSLAFPFDPIQEYFAGIYKQINDEYTKRMKILDRVKVNPVEQAEPVVAPDKPKVNLEAFQDWVDCEKVVAVCFAGAYTLLLIAGIFLAFPVSIENGTRFLIDITAISSALFLLYTSASLIFAIFASRRKEK